MVKDEKIQAIIFELTKKIMVVYNPLKIILFGSYVYGKPTKDSDIDILIVTERDLNSKEVYREQWKLSKDFSIPIQLSFVSGEEFLETKDVIGGITYPASKYGEVIYEKS